MKTIVKKLVKPGSALPQTDGIPVHCSYDRLVPLVRLKPNMRNYNKHPAHQIDLLAKNIETFGWRHPITVSNLSGLIVTGHARYEAAQKIGLSCAPVNFQNFKDAAEEMTVMIADNRLAELAEPDMSALKDILLELDTGAFNMDLTGFDEKAMEDLMTQFHVEDGRDGDKAGASPWDRVGAAAEGVMFAFGDIQARLSISCYERFKAACPEAEVAAWVEGVINACATR